MPAGWRAVFGSPSLTASPGASASTTLQVTSSSTAAVGTYNVTAHGADASRTVTASAAFAVAAPLVIAAESQQFQLRDWIPGDHRGVRVQGRAPRVGRDSHVQDHSSDWQDLERQVLD